MASGFGESSSGRDPQNSSFGESSSNNDAGSFECNICFELAQDPVVTLCGHLFCWPCLYKWLHGHAQSSECPVCKAIVEEEKLVPLYGRGKNSTDPRSKSMPGMNIPHRPAGQRPATAPPPDPNNFHHANPWFMGGAPVASTRFGNFTFSAAIGGLFPLLSFQVHGIPDATAYGPGAGFPYGYGNAFHGGHVHGFPRHVQHGQQADVYLKALLILVGALEKFHHLRSDFLRGCEMPKLFFGENASSGQDIFKAQALQEVADLLPSSTTTAYLPFANEESHRFLGKFNESYQRNREVELETLPGSIHHAKPVIGESTGDSEIRNKPLPEASVRSSLKYEILQLEKQLQDEMMVRCALEKAMGFGSSAVCSSNERSVPKPTKELIREIAVLELEVMHLEQYLLSLYRKAFDQQTSTLSPPASENQMKKPLNSKPELLHESAKLKISSNRGNSRVQSSQTELPQKWTADLEEQNANSGVISLAEYLETGFTDDVPESPNRLSEDMVRCMGAVYCKLVDPPLVFHGFSSSPASSSSSMSALSPHYQGELWSPGYKRESNLDSRLINPFQVEGLKEFSGPYNAMVEVPLICRDRQRLRDVEDMLHNYKLILHRLEIVDPRKLKIDEKLAFWINIHNAIIMHAYIKYGIPEGNAKKTSLSIKAMCTIGGRSINAAMIQTYILGCRTHCTGKWLRTLLYPRLKHKARVAWQSYAIEQPEPLLHFALCSGSHSDPAVRIYYSDQLFQQLESAKEDYIRATVGIWKEQKILLPKLVDSYAKDTKLSSQRLVDMVQCYLPETLRKAMQRCQNGRSKKTIEENLKQASKQTNTDMMDDGEWEAVRPLIAAQVFRKERAKSRVMEGEEIGLVLARASELRSKISNCIGGSGGGGCRQRGGDGDAGGGAATDEEEEEEEEEDEADSLVGIRDALDSLERQLAALQELQHQQRYERESILSQIDCSRMILLSKLKEYKGEELEAIHEVATFAGEAIELDDNLVLPPYPTHLPDLFVLDDIAAGSHFKKNKTTHNGPVAAAKQEGMGTACGTDKNQDDKTSKRFRNIIGLVVKSAIAIVSMMSMVSFAGHQPMLKSRPPTERQISSQCPQGKVLVIEDGKARCIVKERIEVPFEPDVTSPNIRYGLG
ncbi:Ternary complex factor MIP1 [Musa troglodytarum]|uniref:Ternary complex factor MIP1 n=1 Tax=Musa troglodytarum TaxID=320322 RepID=A0A9E7EYB4_9LILI|nr:Ternary complex factor MIP1 [Musa troglodytarum]